MFLSCSPIIFSCSFDMDGKQKLGICRFCNIYNYHIAIIKDLDLLSGVVSLPVKLPIKYVICAQADLIVAQSQGTSSNFVYLFPCTIFL